MARAHRSRARTFVVLGALLVVATAAVAVALVVRDDEGSDGGAAGPRLSDEQEAVLAAATAFAGAVERVRPAEAGLADGPGDADAELLTAVAGLGEVVLAVTPGEPVVEGEAATVPLSTEWRVGDAGWTSTGTLQVVGGADGWRPRWDLAALDSRLRGGDTLAVERTLPDRAAILDGAGEPLVAPTDVIVVGVEPRRVADPDALAAELARLVGVDGPSLAARIEAAAEDAFVEVITLRREDYDPIRDQVRPLPGTVFREDTLLLAPSRTFARGLLGTVGTADEEQVAASEGRLQPGDMTGQSGLQALYDAELRGRPGLDVTVIRPVAPGDDGEEPPGEGPEPEAIALESIPPEPGTPVRTTLDVATQLAADAALADEPRVSGLVAVRPSTGEVLAVANGPSGTTATTALGARVPPGSTFKVVSTLALLRQGLTPDEEVPCPATAEVDGRAFTNAGDFALGTVPFRTDFARSCNTAFVDLSDRLGPDDLAAAAADLGLGVEVDIGIPSQAGSVPPTEGPVDAAASTIGQGRLVANPLRMAGVAATVAAGTWHPPHLVVDPAPDPGPEPVVLDPGEAEVLRDLMRAVVTEGTGEALAGVPGEPVAAKTGTAEFGSEDPPEAHAWVIGFQGDLAFAVFIEGGESGGGTAAPLAARFLEQLAG